MAHWRLSDVALALVTALAVSAAWEGFKLNNRPETSGYGGDFSQFYTAGQIVARGESSRLYDQPYFRGLQSWMREDPLRSLYPPTMALAMAPLARLSYFQALDVWWAIQGVCLVLTVGILFRSVPLPRTWRVHALLGVAALLPLWIAVGIGHLAPLLLLVLAGGLMLHRQGRPFRAGLVLSLLAVKPQLAAGLVVWMLLRRDLATLIGLALGGAVQAAVVALTLGPAIWLDYLHALPMISWVTRVYSYSPLFEQSFAGMASNLCGAAGTTALQTPAMRIAYAMASCIAAVSLCRVVAARRPFPSLAMNPAAGDRNPTRRRGPMNPAAFDADYEYACGVLFMTIFPPYFLVYDQTLLALPLVLLWSTPRWRWGIALLAVMTAPVANLAFSLGFSVTSFVVVATMAGLARHTGKAALLKTEDSRRAPLLWNGPRRASIM